ncbi:MAG: TIGR01457 family HAD-type hydrolase [Brevibacillus sp.]|nr:TIGR01457 family HAD-type hydrolase [Brevibacillus sp.]
MKDYEAYLLDLDGTIYRGSRVIPEAVRFVQALRQEQIPFLYLTNNSSATPQEVAARLTGMGLPTEANEVCTSSMAAAAFLQQQLPPGSSLYVIGEDGLCAALTAAGFVLDPKEPQAVVIGIDRAFTYEKLKVASQAIRSGALFVATNADAALPCENGLLPGNGALVAAVRTASGCEPIVIGKPHKWIVDYALKRLGTSSAQTLIVGDNLNTDIEAGHNSGMDSLLVLTGYATAADARQAAIKPTYVAPDLWSWWTGRR